jgi:hypothetical protein
MEDAGVDRKVILSCILLDLGANGIRLAPKNKPVSGFYKHSQITQ